MVRIAIAVLRIGHRPGRDERVTTHIGLVSRTFGADKIFISDEKIAESLQSVTRRFGGPFSVEVEPDWKRVVREWKGTVVHLTMYGESLEEGVKKVRESRNVLIVVGAEKVPSELYTMATLNISVGNQPHSEVAALAIFLDRLTYGKWVRKKFKGKMRIIPNPRGKTVVQTPR